MKPNNRFGFLRFLLPLLALLIGALACGEVPTDTWWAGSLVRDIKPKGRDYQVTYIQEGSTVESQRITFYTQGGTFRQADITYGKAGQAATESFLYKLPDGAMSERFMQEARTSNENIADILKSKLTWQTAISMSVGQSYGTPFVVTKNENKFLYPGVLPGQENFKVETYSKMGTDSRGYPDLATAQYWYAAIYGDTLLPTGFRPNYTVIEGGTNTYNLLPPDWANQSDAFDTALFLTRNGIFDGLKANNWASTGFDKYGKVRLSIYNPLGFGELAGFQNYIYGFAVDENGKKVDYRIKPVYEVLDGNLFYGAAKPNTPNFGATLRQLRLDIKVGQGDSDEAYQTVAAWVFLKGRFASNGLYAFKVFKPGETADDLVNQLKAEMDRDIPPDIAELLANPIVGLSNDQAHKDAVEAAKGKIITWLAHRQPFDLTVVREKYGLDVIAAVTYADIGDYIVVYEPCGTDEHPAACPRTIPTTPRTQLVWDIAVNQEHGLDNVNFWTTFMGEPAMNAFAMDYVSKGAGDGTGIIFAGLQMLQHINDGSMSYTDAIRLDMRSASWPENIGPAMRAIFGGDWTEYWKN